MFQDNKTISVPTTKEHYLITESISDVLITGPHKPEKEKFVKMDASSEGFGFRQAFTYWSIARNKNDSVAAAFLFAKNICCRY